ncbi:MAG: hypothetical protein UX47_C0001G0009 [Candidatus Collierbacteria bacterium GW2011_GWA2_46_26]|uniref:Uncharacterized protein n=1 Tax=Candidatus Collierbacteria bacterium GW2011_GWA2_46_26 TaxID=1618381 RepID=A0A0G1PLW6_9BACT|nr:MAG: hypothetical protein UW29_C0004G0224 [Candidatus Collierbacteria bacterium GW2011_GWC2_44_13]KKU33726.1 MAG: hypothetical protein UX47_C0001G0009 [Candidatus Collierbacteria bacterium GW2011_GWA2_46_26]
MFEELDQVTAETNKESEVLFKEEVTLPTPMTYKQIEAALHRSAPEHFIWRRPKMMVVQ